MLKTSIYRLSLIIALQLAVVSGVYASSYDIGGSNVFDVAPVISSDMIDFNRLSQNQRSSLKSRSDVIQEVKRRYNAEILKISLDEQKKVYRVRVLMENGKVRNLQISARR